MLIVEGPDCIGKSTLVRALIKRLGELNGGIEPSTDHFGLQDSAIDTVEGYAPRIKPWTVSDRGWLSEVVYGEVLRGKSNVSPAMNYLLDGRQAAVGGFTVIVWTDPSVYYHLLERHWSNAEAFGKDDLRKVAGRFKEHVACTKNEKGWRAPSSVKVYTDNKGNIIYPTSSYRIGCSDPVKVIAGQYLNLYCELGAPEVK